MTPGERRSRLAIARDAADALEARAAELSSLPAVVGFDGFIDDILDAVRTRRSMVPDDYERIATIHEFADRCRAAAGVSTNIELIRRESRFGGNGPLLASGLAALGTPTTFIGCIGRADDPGRLHPIYEPLAARCRAAIPIAAPGHTDALEFDDGKIMLNQTAPVQAATWPAIERSVGPERIARMIAEAALIGMVNWSLCGGVEGIWTALIDRVLPSLPPPPGAAVRRAFVDLSDPAKRTDADIHRALALLARMNTVAPVTLGINLAEAARLALVMGVRARSEPGPALADAAADLRAAIGLDTVVIHPRQGAAGATAMGDAAWFIGPMVRTPRLSTGAGDHFNAGFALAQTLDLPLAQCLAIATSASGCYVRDAASPSRARVAGLLGECPDPE